MGRVRRQKMTLVAVLCAGCSLPEVNPEGVVATALHQGLRRADRYETEWRGIGFRETDPEWHEVGVPKPRVWLVRWEGWQVSAGGRISRWSWAEEGKEEAPERERRGWKFRARVRWRGIEPTRVYLGVEFRF